MKDLSQVKLIKIWYSGKGKSAKFIPTVKLGFRSGKQKISK